MKKPKFTVLFYLRPPNKAGKSMITLRVQFPKNEKTEKEGKTVYKTGDRFVYSTGWAIEPKFWNNEKQTVKTSSDSYRINTYLMQLKIEVDRIVFAAVENKKDPIDELKMILKDETNQKNDFFGIYELYLDNLKKNNKRRTLQTFQTLLSNLKEFDGEVSQIKFEYVSDNLINEFSKFLTTKYQNNNVTVGKKIKELKTFFIWAKKMKYTEIVLADLKLKNQNNTQNNEWLTWEEVNAIRDLDLTENTRLEAVRDLFLMEVFTGLRYSDIGQLRKDHIKTSVADGQTVYEVDLTMIKTDSRICLPLNRFAYEILERHNFELPNRTNQEMNRCLKIIAEMAGITTEVRVVNFIGTERIEKTVKKWELVCTHTGRRTMASLLYQNDTPIEVIQQVLGHHDIKTTIGYVKNLGIVGKSKLRAALNKIEGIV